MAISGFPVGVFAVLMCAMGSAQAQSISESWLRQASISCGGGMSAEMEGEISGALLRGLKVVGGEGDGHFKLEDLNRLIDQFNAGGKVAVTNNYYTCLHTLIQFAVDSSGLPPREVTLESPVAVAGLEVVKRGQRVVMQLHDTVAFKDPSLIFTIEKIYMYNSSPSIYIVGRTRPIRPGTMGALPSPSAKTVKLCPIKLTSKRNLSLSLATVDGVQKTFRPG